LVVPEWTSISVFFSGEFWPDFYFRKMAAPGTKEKTGVKWWKFARKHLAMDGMGQKALWWHQLACPNPKLSRVLSSSDEAGRWSRLEATSSPIDFACLRECLSPRHRIFLHNSCRRSPARAFTSFFFSPSPTLQRCHVAKELWSFVCIRQP